MKTHFFLFIVGLTFLFSCSGDDEGSSNPNSDPETKVLYPTTFNLTFTELEFLLKLEYNSDKMVSRLVISSGLEMKYQYNAGKISTITKPDETVVFSYDNMGRISSFKRGEADVAVEYSATDNSYSYTENDYLYTIKVDDQGTILEIKQEEIDEDNFTLIKFNFDNAERKGVLQNTNEFILQSVIADVPFSNQFILFNLSKKPIDQVVFIDQEDTTYTNFNNNFDENGYLTESEVYSQNGSHGINEITYSEL